MACFAGGPNVWIIGQRMGTAAPYLAEAFAFISGNNQIGIAQLHGGGKNCSVGLEKALFEYEVDDEGIRNLYIEVTTGIQMASAAPAAKVAPQQTVLPFGGPRENVLPFGGPRPN
jgi:hypothetical protein